VLSAALDSGVAVSAVLIFFILQYPKGGSIGANNVAKWWGNTVSFTNADGDGRPYLPLPDVGYFGPANGTW
jgi:hypothetical protein